MNRDSENPLGMIPDPISGEAFVFPVTKCTRERKLFFKRANEIHALLFITKHAYKGRHRIVHASSILDKNQLISVGLEVFHGLYGVYFLLTDFVDFLFGKRFDYPRPEINPAGA
jgi:hypothetical protein